MVIHMVSQVIASMTAYPVSRLHVKPGMCSIGQMQPTSYRRICMVIDITSNFLAFFVLVNFDRSRNHS